jgi:hypothetical protein
VTDPLLWRLAIAVADTHQPDENGVCDHGSCLAAAWPCAAWNNAQEGLRAAQASTAPPVEPPAERRHEPPPEWFPNHAPVQWMPQLPAAQLAITSAV